MSIDRFQDPKGQMLFRKIADDLEHTMHALREYCGETEQAWTHGNVPPWQREQATGISDMTTGADTINQPPRVREMLPDPGLNA